MTDAPIRAAAELMAPICYNHRLGVTHDSGIHSPAEPHLPQISLICSSIHSLHASIQPKNSKLISVITDGFIPCIHVLKHAAQGMLTQ